MKRGMIALLAALSMSALVAGGCANKEVVKTEEPAPVTQKAEPVKVEKAKPEPPKVETKVEPAKPEPPKQAEGSGEKASAAVNFEAVYFDFDKSDLRQEARDMLYKNAEIMLKNQPNVKVRIEGNCDERGSAEYNLALGERRAKSAMQYLITLGVAADRLTTLSYGKEKATVNATDDSVWSKDRRDDLVIVK